LKGKIDTLQNLKSFQDKISNIKSKSILVHKEVVHVLKEITDFCYRTVKTHFLFKNFEK